MANKLTDERVQALARHYCTNGYVKSRALQNTDLIALESAIKANGK